MAQFLLYSAVGFLFIFSIPNIIRGSKVLWVRWCLSPVGQWWRYLPDWCGWGIVISILFSFSPFYPDVKPESRVPWGMVLVMLIYVWTTVGIIHGCKFIDRRLSAHFARKRQQQEQQRHMADLDQPFEVPD